MVNIPKILIDLITKKQFAIDSKTFESEIKLENGTIILVKASDVMITISTDDPSILSAFGLNRTDKPF